MSALADALRARVEALPAGLRDHVLRVIVEAKRLASVYGLDAERLEIAALGHDLYRAHGPKQLLSLAEVLLDSVNEVEQQAPILLHGRLAALALSAEYGVDDADVLNAVRYHTTARAGMTLFEKALFLADKIEPEKASEASAMERVRQLADSDPGAAIVCYLDYQVRRALGARWMLHPDLVAAWNELADAGRGHTA